MESGEPQSPQRCALHLTKGAGQVAGEIMKQEMGWQASWLLTVFFTQPSSLPLKQWEGPLSQLPVTPIRERTRAFKRQARVPPSQQALHSVSGLLLQKIFLQKISLSFRDCHTSRAQVYLMECVSLWHLTLHQQPGKPLSHTGSYFQPAFFILWTAWPSQNVLLYSDLRKGFMVGYTGQNINFLLGLVF